MAFRITEYMRPEWIAAELKAVDKNSLLLELATLVGQSVPRVDVNDLYLKLVEREQKASTGADHGVAIPHATIDSADCMMVIFGKSPHGIPFNSLDNEDSRLFFAVISPRHARPEEVSYLQLISSICRLMRSAATRKRLLMALTVDEILDVLRMEEMQRLAQPISFVP